jgi:hypothetical protein
MKLNLEITVNNPDQELFRGFMVIARKLESPKKTASETASDTASNPVPDSAPDPAPNPDPDPAYATETVSAVDEFTQNDSIGQNPGLDRESSSGSATETGFYYLYAGGSPEQVVKGRYGTDVARSRDEVAAILPEGYILVTHDRNMNVVRMEKRRKDGLFEEWAEWRSPSEQSASADSIRLKADGTPRGKPGRKPKTVATETAPSLHTTPPPSLPPVQTKLYPPLPHRSQYEQYDLFPLTFAQEIPFSAPPVMSSLPEAVEVTPSAQLAPLPPSAAAVPQVDPQTTTVPNGIISMEDLKSLAAQAFNKHNIEAFGLLSGKKWLDGTEKPFSVFTIENVPQEHWNRLAQEFAALRR